MNALCVVQSQHQLEAPYPHLFSPAITADGLISDQPRDSTRSVMSATTLSSLQASPDLGSLLEQLLTESKRLNIRRFHRFLATGLEEDDWRECLSRLADARAAYSDGQGEMA
jgi:hypothetical protein